MRYAPSRTPRKLGQWKGGIRIAPDFDETPPGMIDVANLAPRAAAALPPHHRDPFDRMLIAQAALEELTFVSRDARLGAYGITILPP